MRQWAIQTTVSECFTAENSVKVDPRNDSDSDALLSDSDSEASDKKGI